VLDALIVRRPDARPLAAWMEERGVFAVTTIMDEQGPSGFLLFPVGARSRALTLEEARAARRLADRLSAVLGVSSALARSRQRELEASERLASLERETERLTAFVHTRREERSLLAHGLAGAVRRHAYSAASRLAIAELERLGRGGGDLVLVVPAGVEVLGWAALAHLASPRQNGQLALANASESALQDPAYWESGSLLQEVAGGTLVLSNLAALPAAAQDSLAIRLAQRGAGPLDTALDFALIAPLAVPLAALVEERQLSRALAQYFAERELRLPALLDRPEDLRALVFDRLDRSGARHGAEPLGIEPQALRLLVDHTWPGNDLELDHIVTSAAHVAQGPRVTVANLAAAGFAPLAGSDDALDLAAASAGGEPPLPLGSPRRRRRR
jgi:hypothetical protein